MRIAIPIWEDKVSPVFDTALSLLIVDYENHREVSRIAYDIGEDELSWKCRRIMELTPDVIICGAISHIFLNMLKGEKIAVIEHVSGRTEEILKAYYKGRIFNSRFLMPGCKTKKRGCNNGK
jgi:predicted Fe-Mo cluster-binding NifX family protein